MNIDGKSWRTIWMEEGGESVGVIDQTNLPHFFTTCSLRSCDDVSRAIKKMVVRGAPLIGVTAAFGLMLALQDDPSDLALEQAFHKLNSTRPTAVNLQWALRRVFETVKSLPPEERANAAMREASLMVDEDVQTCSLIGDYGAELLKKLLGEKLFRSNEEPLNVLTHCNAGWLATVDWGTALSPIYKAHRAGANIHVWVDETRPRNQGASLTAYELASEGVPHTVIVDNAGGHLMQNGMVDAVIVGCDRATRSGDVCNKIGTYLKALAAKDNSIPFYVALPSSTIDWSISNGVSEVPIEIRSPTEITEIEGLAITSGNSSTTIRVSLTPSLTKGFNPAFDVTPAELVTALITEKGVVCANEVALQKFFKEEGVV